MDILFKNLFFYIVPAMILLGLSITLFVRSYHLRESRFAGTIIGIYSLMFILEWLRMEMPIEHSFWMHHGIIGTLTVFTLGLIIHSAYLIIEPHRTLHLKFSPAIFYVPLFCQPLYILFIYQRYGTTYLEIDGWYYVNHPLYTYVANPFLALYLLLMLYILLHGLHTAPTNGRKHLYKWFILNLTIVLCASVFLVVLFRQYQVLPEPMMVVIFFTSMIYAIGMLKHQFSPSLAQRYHKVMSLSPIGILVISSNGTVKEINKAAQELTNLQPGHSIFDALAASNFAMLRKVRHIITAKENTTNLPIVYTQPDSGAQYNFLLNASKMFIENNINYVLTIRDVTLEKKHEAMTYRLAYYDSLTEIHNRTYFQTHIVEHFEQFPHCALILCDLNYFKQINDTYGHTVGDNVLKFTADQFKLFVNDDTIHVARLGGDEFIFFIEDATVFPVDEFVHRLNEHFKTVPFWVGNDPLHISPSFGYAIRFSSEENYDKLFHLADLEMYENKREIKRLNEKRT